MMARGFLPTLIKGRYFRLIRAIQQLLMLFSTILNATNALYFCLFCIQFNEIREVAHAFVFLHSPTIRQSFFHFIEQPMLGICSAGPLLVSATSFMPSNKSRRASSAAASLRLASKRPRYCNFKSAL